MDLTKYATDTVYRAWNDVWSARWNMAFYAEHGYIVVAVNPTGSTGYGQKFVDDIRGMPPFPLPPLLDNTGTILTMS